MNTTASGVRQNREAAERKLARLQRFFLLVGIIYLALHAAVSLAAYMDKGVAAGLATLLTLGFGDLYWAFAWAGEPGFVAERYAAIVAAVMAFTSWTTRRWTTRYIYRVAAGTFAPLDEAGSDPSDNNDDKSDQPSGSGERGAVAVSPPGGAA